MHDIKSKMSVPIIYYIISGLSMEFALKGKLASMSFDVAPPRLGLNNLIQSKGLFVFYVFCYIAYGK